jgi:hypothetical protein
MNRAVLSLCLFGTALATANTLITQRQSCPSAGANIVAASAETSPGTVAAAHSTPAQAAKAKPALAPKDQAVPPAQAKATKTEDTKPAAAKDLDQTGSVDQTTREQSEKPAPLSQTDPQVKLGDSEQWAEVVLAARAHSAASVSSPTVRHYRVGTRLKVIERRSGWIKVIDPTTSNQGWIFEKYLMLKEGSDNKQVEGPGQSQRTAQSGSQAPGDPNLGAPAQPGPYVRPYTRKQGWRRSYRYVWPPAGLAIRIYPGW